MSEARSENNWQAVYQPFVEAVRRFVSLVEDEVDLPAPFYLAALNKAILEVAVTGFDVQYPDTEDDEEFEIDTCDPGFEMELSIRRRIEQKLSSITAPVKAKNDYEPYDLVMKMFESDIAEGYRDLATSLRAWDVGHAAARREACWQWRFSKGHWHEHLYRALYGLCLFRFNEGVIDSVDDALVAEQKIMAALEKAGYIRSKD